MTLDTALQKTIEELLDLCRSLRNGVRLAPRLHLRRAEMTACRAVPSASMRLRPATAPSKLFTGQSWSWSWRCNKHSYAPIRTVTNQKFAPISALLLSSLFTSTFDRKLTNSPYYIANCLSFVDLELFGSPALFE